MFLKNFSLTSNMIFYKMARTCLIKPYFEGPNIKPEEGEWCLKSYFEKLEGKSYYCT